MRPSPWQLMEASGFLAPPSGRAPRRGIPLTSPYSPQAGCVSALPAYSLSLVAACLDVQPPRLRRLPSPSGIAARGIPPHPMEASGFLDPLRVEPPRRGYPLPPRTARKRAASRLCRVLALARRCMPRRAALHGRRRWPPFTPSRGSCRAKVRPASGPTLAGRHAASSAPSPAMLRLRRHIAGDMRSYTHFSTLYPSASKKLTIIKFEIWTMIFPFKVVHNSSSIKKFKTS